MKMVRSGGSISSIIALVFVRGGAPLFRRSFEQRLNSGMLPVAGSYSIGRPIRFLAKY